MAKKETEVYLGGGNNLNMKSSQLVTLHQTLTLVVPKAGAHQLSVKIEADFDTIPQEYHEVFLNMLSSKYLGTVSYGDNPFSQCIPAPTKRWWQFWL